VHPKKGYDETTFTEVADRICEGIIEGNSRTFDDYLQNKEETWRPFLLQNYPREVYPRIGLDVKVLDVDVEDKYIPLLTALTSFRSICSKHDEFFENPNRNPECNHKCGRYSGWACGGFRRR
jgi:hypothetical protein